MTNFFNHFSREEIDSIYCGEGERYVVSLIVSYSEESLRSNEWKVTPHAAAASALDLIRDIGSTDTVWFVFDRQTGQMHHLRQEDFDPEWNNHSEYVEDEEEGE